MIEHKVKLDHANKSILLRALGDVYYGQRARGGSAEETGRLILRVNDLPAGGKLTMSAAEYRLAKAALNPLHPTALPTQIATMLLSLAVTAFGVSLVVNMGVVPNAPDGLVQVIAEKLKRRFGDVKVVFDCSHVAASLALSLIFMYNLGGFGVTTAISALFLGHVINVANKLFAQRFIRVAFGK